MDEKVFAVYEHSSQPRWLTDGTNKIVTFKDRVLAENYRQEQQKFYMPKLEVREYDRSNNRL